jgi:hypothetical protein
LDDEEEAEDEEHVGIGTDDTNDGFLILLLEVLVGNELDNSDWFGLVLMIRLFVESVEDEICIAIITIIEYSIIHCVRV